MPFIAALALAASTTVAHVDTYEVVEVRRQSAFAGKLGQRVREDLVLKSSSGTILVHVRGFYHTANVRRSSRLMAGDQVSIPADADHDGATVSRETVRKVR